LSYAGSDKFQPGTEIDPTVFDKLFSK